MDWISSERDSNSIGTGPLAHSNTAWTPRVAVYGHFPGCLDAVSDFLGFSFPLVRSALYMSFLLFVLNTCIRSDSVYAGDLVRNDPVYAETLAL